MSVKKIVGLILLAYIIIFCCSCEPEEPVYNSCQCEYAIYVNPITGTQTPYEDEPTICVDGVPRPIILEKGNSIFSHCMNEPRY